MSITITVGVTTVHDEMTPRKRSYTDGMYRPTRVESRWMVKNDDILAFMNAEVSGPNIKKDGTEGQAGSRQRVSRSYRDSDAESLGELGEEIRDVLLDHRQQVLHRLSHLTEISARQ